MYPYTSGSGAALEPVSPPSSPEPFDGNNEYMDYDVSPIDDEPDVFQRQLEANQPPTTQPSSQAPRGVHTQLTEDDDYQQQPTQVISGPRSGIGKTSIPTMRRERRKQRDAAHAQANKDHRHSPRPGDEPLPKPSQPMGWDDPTNPKSVAQAGPPELAPKFGTTTTVMSGSQDRRQASNPNTASFGQRMRHQFGRGKAEPVQNRPAWNGASGREAQVSPVRDDLNAAPLKIPPKSAKRNERARAPVNLPVTDINEGASAAATAAVRRLMPIKTAPAADRSRGNSPAFETPKSGVSITPQAYANAKPTQIAASPQQWPPRDSSMSTPSVTTAPSNLGVPGQFNIPRKSIGHPRTPAHAPQLSTSSSIYSDNPANDDDDEATWRRLASGDPFGRQPPPPPPPPPRDEWSPETVPSNSDEEEVEIPIKSMPIVSVMERKRPIPGRNSPAAMMDNAIVISLKTATIAEKEAEKEAQAEAEKELPPVPSEPLEPEDRIAFLSSQLESLAIRRVNLTKSIKQLTELMPKDMLIVSAEVQRKREEEKRKVEVMQQELSDIQQQEYVLGLKLHRAYRRQDRELEHNTGTLWVRRVTG